MKIGLIIWHQDTQNTLSLYRKNQRIQIEMDCRPNNSHMKDAYRQMVPLNFLQVKMLRLLFGVKLHLEEEIMEADEQSYFTSVVLDLS